MARRDTERPPRLVCSACAHEGGGKTTFSLTAPGPIDLFMIDPNTEEIIEKEGLTDSRDLHIHPITFPAVAFGEKDEIKAEAEPIWQNEFITPMKELLHKIRRGTSPTKTIIIDTATELRDLQLLKWFGKTTQIIKELYTGPNMEFKGLLNSLGRSGVNVVLLHRLKDVYADKEVRKVTGRGRSEVETVSEKVPGVYTRDGWNKTGFYVNAEVQLFHDPTRSEKTPSQFGMVVTRCTARPMLIGHEYWGREKHEDGERVRRASFPFLATQIYPKTSLQDWE